MTDPTVLDHIGIAVESIDERIGFYEALGLELEGYDEVPEQGVRVAFLPVGDSRLELLEPTGPDTPIARHLERRGPGLHHVCLRVPDLDAAVLKAEAAGLEALPPRIRAGAGGHRVAFFHPRTAGGVLLELSEAADVK